MGEALDAVQRGIDIAITPDGPQGPAQKFKLGAVFLASESGCPIVLGACVPAKAWRLKSWDRFYIPKPFSRVELIVTDPIFVQPRLTDEEAEAKRQEMETILNDLTEQAELAVRGRK